jgi:hypothetical protein
VKHGDAIAVETITLGNSRRNIDEKTSDDLAPVGPRRPDLMDLE